jgi:hypothetical protein
MIRVVNAGAEGGVHMSDRELTLALEEVLLSMSADLNDLDDLEDEVETAARAVKW